MDENGPPQGLRHDAPSMPDAERQQWLWAHFHPMFDLDDGALCDIVLAPITPADAGVLCAHLCAYGQISAHTTWGWRDQATQEHPFTDLVQAGIAAASGGAQPVYVSMTTLQIGPHRIPSLGVSIDPAGITLDYRKGPDWTPAIVDAFFQLLVRMVRAAPSQRVDLDVEGSAAWRQHVQHWWTRLRTLGPAGLVKEIPQPQRPQEQAPRRTNSGRND